MEAPNISPPHLLKIGSAADLCSVQILPAWARAPLESACWVVARRALPREGMVPVGVRGTSRDQRFAAYLPIQAVLDRVTPEQLVRHRAWRSVRHGRDLPAFQALDLICGIMSGFDLSWGPTGSVGFEIATGFPAATPNSDLDLLIRAPHELPPDLCRRLSVQLCERLPVRADAQIETGTGAIALIEYAHGRLPIIFRSSAGPKLVYHPWDRADESCSHFSRTGISGREYVSLPSRSS